MQIINSTKDMDKRTAYKMYKPENPVSIKNVEDDTRITVSRWMEYTDVNADGVEMNILAIYEESTNITYQSNSATFRKEFYNMIDMLGDEELEIIKKSGTTKSDRPYVTCVLA